MLDDMDRALIHALRIDGRAPFNRIAAVLGTSPQTIARRYQRLRTEAALRVVGVAEPHRAGLAQWLVRLTTSPRGSLEIAQALVNRPDTSWVKLTSGGTEIIAIVNTSASSSSHSLLLRYIPRTANVVSVSAHCLLHTYLGGPTFWRGGGALSEKQTRQLLQPDPDIAAAAGDATAQRQHVLADRDRELLAVLQRDGRATLAELATATGYSTVTVARRLADLQASRSIFFDVEIDAVLLGASMQALLWMSVTPTHLDEVATVLAKDEALAFVAATTGPTNLVATALCEDSAHLHSFIAHRLGALPEIRALETSPVMQTLKATSPATRVDPVPRRHGLPGRGAV